MRDLIPHSRPTLGPQDQRAVAEAVSSGMLVGGETVASFETELAAYLHRNRAVALSSGSAALHLALLALDLPSGSQAAIPSYGCISLLQAVRRADLEPLPVDCDPSSFQMDGDDLLRRISSRTRAIINVHTFGLPSILPETGLPVIEDVATAFGATVDGNPVGSSGSLTVCSFHATKMLTTGSGGAVVGDDIVDRVADLVDYDARNDASVRFNERMGAIPAALGRAQLSRVHEFVKRRREIAAIYSGTDLAIPKTPEGAEPAWHRFVVRVPGGAATIREHLQSVGIASPAPIHEPLHRILGLEGYAGAETAHDEALSLPIYPTLSDEQACAIAQEVHRCPAAK